MKKAWIATTLALLLALTVSISGSAQTPSHAPLSPQALASILALPAAASANAAPASGAIQAAVPAGQLKSLCSALAHCQSGTISCSSSTSVSSCSAADTNCPSEQGHVTCDGVTTWCQPACGCTEGQFKTVTTGPICGCDDGRTTPKDRYQCIGGQWVYQYSFCGGPFCQGF